MIDEKKDKPAIPSALSPTGDFAPSASGSVKGVAFTLNEDSKKIIKVIGQEEIPGSVIMGRLSRWNCKEVAARMVCLVRKFDQHSPERPDLTEKQHKIMDIIETGGSGGKVERIVETLGSKGFGIQSLPFELAGMCRKYAALTQGLGLVTLPESKTSNRIDVSVREFNKT